MALPKPEVNNKSIALINDLPKRVVRELWKKEIFE